MKKTLLISFLLSFTIFINSQTYLDKTPARYFNTLIQNRNEDHNLTSKNKIKKMSLIDVLKKDTSSVKIFNSEGQPIEGVEYSNGRRTTKWTYTYPENARIYTIYEYQNGIPDKEPSETWNWEYDKNKNLVSQKTTYKSGTVLHFKYTYDQNNNMTLKEYYANKKLISSVLYRYRNNLLTELITRKHSLINGRESIVPVDTATYIYNDRKDCLKITYNNGNAKSTYDFTYSDGKLTQEDRISFDNYSGKITYSYKDNLLTHIADHAEGRGTAETKIYYDSQGRVSRTESYNDGGLTFRYFFVRNNQTRLVQEYTYDQYNFLKKITRKENDILISSFEYLFEYY
ncbi:hypothetical protein ACKW6Q_07990 [Chryseobacterium kwangjuense]|uniref:Sugar-binding protein n=1 Tax=Chryseobacterium kwangjuense TaxID=267125 RepID=A0ABW9K375_9FLAO